MFTYQRTFWIFFVSVFVFGSFSSIAGAHEENSSKVVQTTAEGRKAYSATVVDINKATAEELMRLKGIGKKRAEAVLADREGNGQFNRVEDLSRVKGLGEKFVSRILSQNQGIIQAGK